jgi:hypothetical protein
MPVSALNNSESPLATDEELKTNALRQINSIAILLKFRAILIQPLAARVIPIFVAPFD